MSPGLPERCLRSGDAAALNGAEKLGKGDFDEPSIEAMITTGGHLEIFQGLNPFGGLEVRCPRESRAHWGGGAGAELPKHRFGLQRQ